MSKQNTLKNSCYASMYWICFGISRFLEKDIKKVFTGLIHAAAVTGQLPDCEKCIRYYLEQCGAERRPLNGKRRTTLENICKTMNRPDLTHILVFEGEYFPTCLERCHDAYSVVSDTDGYQERYGGSGNYIKSIYTKTQKTNKAIIKEATQTDESRENKFFEEQLQKKTEAPGLVFFNPNPRGNHIGDCGTRAICAAVNLSWKETVQWVASCAFKSKLEYKAAYINALIEKGFIEHDAPRRKGHRMSVKNYLRDCENNGFFMNRICFEVKRGYSSPHLVTARLVGDKYQLMDTWDSSGWYIQKYWTCRK